MKIFTSLLCIAAVCSALPKKTKDDDHYMHPHIKSGRVGNKAPNPEELTAAYWRRNAQQTLAEHLALQPNTNQAKNVVLFMGDGMSIPTLTAARIHGVGEDGELVFDNFPYTGHSRTYCVDSMVADSACSSIAYLTGVKGNYGTLGVTAAVPRDDCAAIYANGPGYKPAEGNGDRYDISNDIMTDVKYDYPALAPLTSETHGGDDVGVFAVGPWAHLFTGVFEQNVIPHMIAYAACIGDGLTACSQR
ncbi:hypothetical protein B566_EDAN002845 [Ephemera danica]|nr:hypothetical protein B566_EDAN002845 [Ephemera danica]